MSPERTPNLQRTQTPISKPYTRNITPTLLPRIATYLPGNAQLFDLSSAQVAERAGFPTYSQFKQIEVSYLESLTPRRQGKALISQSMFDRIWGVLHHPETQSETAQFRFWARKMFTISKNYRVTLGIPEGVEVEPQEVLLHDNLLVAIQEQLYDLLCYCHGSTGHGGRDKTCALIRKHYTWVPKDLVSSFIKTCPTCIVKKCGNLDVNGSISQALLSEADRSLRLSQNEEDIPNHLQTFTDSRAELLHFQNTGHLAWPSKDGPEGSPFMVSPDPQTQGTSESCSHGDNMPRHLGAPCNHFHPMVREVSLYKGIPNGWQYRFDDYASAHAEFMEYKKNWENNLMPEDPDPRMRAMRPRIPSIAPLWGPDGFPKVMRDAEQYNEQQQKQFELPLMKRSLDISESSLPPTLQHLLMDSPRLGPSHVPQIDPALLELSNCTGEQITIPVSPTATFSDDQDEGMPHQGLDDETPLPSLRSSSSIKRAGAPPLHLDIRNTQKTFQALLEYRDTFGSGNNSDDMFAATSNNSKWRHAEASPTSSADSCTSQLSAFPMASTSSISPETSALTTPVDECDATGESIIKGKGKALPSSIEMELSSSIQAKCGF